MEVAHYVKGKKEGHGYVHKKGKMTEAKWEKDVRLEYEKKKKPIPLVKSIMAKESTFPTIKEEDKSFATSINKSSDQTNRE